MKIRHYLAFSLLLFVQTLAAQNINVTESKIKLTVSSFIDLAADTTVVKPSEFIIDFPLRTIQWKQKNGSNVNTIQISSLDDQWTTTSNGRMVLSILWNGKEGTLELKKKNGDFTLLMDANPSGRDRLYLSFQISSFENI